MTEQELIRRVRAMRLAGHLATASQVGLIGSIATDQYTASRNAQPYLTAKPTLNVSQLKNHPILFTTNANEAAISHLGDPNHKSVKSRSRMLRLLGKGNAVSMRPESAYGRPTIYMSSPDMSVDTLRHEVGHIIDKNVPASKMPKGLKQTFISPFTADRVNLPTLRTEINAWNLSGVPASAPIRQAALKTYTTAAKVPSKGLLSLLLIAAGHVARRKGLRLKHDLWLTQYMGSPTKYFPKQAR